LYGKTVQKPFVTGLLNKKLATVLQCANSSIPTPCENRLSLKDEVYRTNAHTHTHKIDDCKEIIVITVSTVAKHELQIFLNNLLNGYQTCLRFEGGQIQHLT
jgi:hypothetical protein